MAAGIVTTPVPKDKPQHEWKTVGEYRITEYDIYCNDPVGWQSSSGKRLREGYVACNDFPFGTKLKIGKKTYTVMDRCGMDNTVDIFVENNCGYCKCNKLDYKQVKVKQ